MDVSEVRKSIIAADYFCSHLAEKILPSHGNSSILVFSFLRCKIWCAASGIVRIVAHQGPRLGCHDKLEESNRGRLARTLIFFWGWWVWTPYDWDLLSGDAMSRRSVSGRDPAEGIRQVLGKHVKVRKFLEYNVITIDVCKFSRLKIVEESF
jgi:hypothetical protein